MSKKPFVIYTLDKPRNLKLSIEAQWKIEDHGIELAPLVMNAEKITKELNIPTKKICIILWAMMVEEDRNLTPEKVAKLIVKHSNFIEAFGKTVEEVGNSLPELLTGKTLEELGEIGEDPNA
jgi:hypothetical protein